MDDYPEKNRYGSRERLSRRVAEEERRKIKAQRTRKQRIWFGLGMFGIVGWSVAIPTLAGVALGIWIDTRWPGRFSWTLMLLFFGIVMGCLNAWYWVTLEQESIEREKESPADDE